MVYVIPRIDGIEHVFKDTTEAISFIERELNEYRAVGNEEFTIDDYLVIEGEPVALIEVPVKTKIVKKRND